MIVQDFQAYLDSDGLYQSAPGQAGGPPGNAPLYTSEVTILRLLGGDDKAQVHADFVSKIVPCIKGVLYRSPVGKYGTGTSNQESWDDYTGVFAAMSMLTIKLPAPLQLPLLLRRFPQLTFLKAVAEGAYKPWKFWYWPFELYTALYVAFAAQSATIVGTDTWCLTWLTYQATKQHSFIIRLAGKHFFKLLYKVAPGGMSQIAGLRFSPNGPKANPYSVYWKDVQ